MKAESHALCVEVSAAKRTKHAVIIANAQEDHIAHMWMTEIINKPEDAN